MGILTWQSYLIYVFAWRDIYMTAERAVLLVKKVTHFGEFGYLSSSYIRKSITVMFLSLSR